ncbi:MAG: HAD family hydrolase [Gallionella sp.]|jgi:putative hydrolase of the HAD superfamily
MIVKGIIFDINGTLVDVRTNEWLDEVYRVIGNLLSYQGVLLEADVVKALYFQLMKEQREAKSEPHPEFDAIDIFRKIMTQHATDFTRSLPKERLEQLPVLLAQTYRAASRFKLQPYSGVAYTVAQLHLKYHLAIVSDGQATYAIPELNAVGLSGYFDPIFISGQFGYRKPDPRLFIAALAEMQMDVSEVLFVGNDMYRDVCGAQSLGIKTVFFKSNQGTQEKEGVKPDYIIYSFPELLNAIRFFEQQ